MTGKARVRHAAAATPRPLHNVPDMPRRRTFRDDRRAADAAKQTATRALSERRTHCYQMVTENTLALNKKVIHERHIASISASDDAACVASALSEEGISHHDIFSTSEIAESA